ncbi:MAG: hypothetical protein RQ982_10295 [Gammaproteobacteria bacterium]|nr:hypothetical protein [Gammaproteobacteria bacterium]
MSIIEELEMSRFYIRALQQGSKARIKITGQVVELKKVSEHGISVVSFRTGDDYFISNVFLEPLSTVH